jgi:hypothetical protein
MAVLSKVEKALTQKTDALKRMRSKIAEQSESAVEMVAIVGGGAAGGYLNKEWGANEMTGLDYSVVVAGVAVGAGILGVGGDLAKPLAYFGAGILAHEAGKKTESA